MSGMASKERALEVVFPDILYDLWNWFLDLHYARGSNMNGAAGIGFLDMQAYCQLKRLQLETWQIDVIRNLDSLFLNSQIDK